MDEFENFLHRRVCLFFFLFSFFGLFPEMHMVQEDSYRRELIRLMRNPCAGADTSSPYDRAHSYRPRYQRV